MVKRKLLSLLLTFTIALSAPMGALATEVSGNSVVDVELPATGYVHLDDSYVPDVVDAPSWYGEQLNPEGAGAESAFYSGIEESVVNFNPYQQGNYNTCWAFAALSACRINAQKKGISVDTYEYSVPHMAYYATQKPATLADPQGNQVGDYTRSVLGENYLAFGNNPRVSMWELASWIGPKEDDGKSAYSYKNADKDAVFLCDTKDAYLDDVLHVENIYISGIDKSYRSEVKKLICQYGSVQAGYHSDANYDSMCMSKVYEGSDADYGNYYYNGAASANHSVLLIGWDDNYAKENFVNTPSEDGAWLVLNSWGEENSARAQNGYFWISYEDTSLLGEKVVLAYDVAASDNFDHNYQYDGSGGIKTTAVKRAVQLFTLDSVEQVGGIAVGLSQSNRPFTASVYAISEPVEDFNVNWCNSLFDKGESVTYDGKSVSATLLCKKNVGSTYAGYHTVTFEQASAALDEGTLLAVVLDFDKTTSVYRDTTYIESGYWNFKTGEDEYAGVYSTDGQTYEQLPSGDAFRIKMFTDDAEVRRAEVFFAEEEYTFELGDAAAAIAAETLFEGISSTEEYYIRYSSSNNTFLHIDEKTGKITSMKVGGPVQVDAVLYDKAGKEVSRASCDVNIKSTLKGISVEDAIEMVKGTTKKLSCTAIPSSATLPAIKWVSLNEDVATVDKEGKVTAVSVGNAMIKAVVDELIYDTCQVTVISKDEQEIPGEPAEPEEPDAPEEPDTPSAPEEKISIMVANIKDGSQLLLGQVLTMGVTTTPSSQADISFTSSNTDIISVDADGKLVAKGIGKADIYITVSGADGEETVKKLSIVVKGIDEGEPVKPQEPGNNGQYSIMIDNMADVKTITLGKNVKLDVSVEDNLGNACTCSEISFTGDNTYVSVSSDGTVTALKSGTGIVKIEAVIEGVTVVKTLYVSVQPDSSGSSTSSNNKTEDTKKEPVKEDDNPRKDVVTKIEPKPEVQKNYVKSIKLTAEQMQISPRGGKTQVEAVVKPAGAENKEVTWHSSNSKYAKVSKDGFVTAKKQGAGHTVVITCKATDGSGVVGSIAIRITKDYIEKLTLTSKNAEGKVMKKKTSMNAKEKLLLDVTIESTGKDIVKKLIWTSSNPDWASVDQNGKVRANVEGRGHWVTITATTVDGAKKASYKIYIREVQKISVAKKFEDTYMVKKKTVAKKKVVLKLKAKTTGNSKLAYEVIKTPKDASKCISVSRKGKVTLKKGTKPGVYKIRITAPETDKYMKKTKVVKIKVK